MSQAFITRMQYRPVVNLW